MINIGLDHYNCICSRTAKHRDHHGCTGLGISAHPETHIDTLVLNTLAGAGNIFQVHRRAAALSDDEVVVFVSGGQLSLGLEQKAAVWPVELARTGVCSPVLDRTRQIFQRDVADRHRRWIGLDPHRRLRAIDCDLAHAGQYAKPLAHLSVGIVVELSFGNRVTDQGDIFNRLVVRICLGESGRARQIDGKLCLRPRDGRLHIGRRAIEALREIKLQNEARVPLTIIRGHEFQARDLHKLPLQWRGNIVGHRIRRGSWIVDLYLDDRIVDGRQIAYRQSRICQDPEQENGDSQRDRHYRTANKDFGEVHEWPPLAPPAWLPAFEDGAGGAEESTRTLPPGRTSIWPASTTRSLAATPSVTTTSSPWRCPNFTGRSSAVSSDFST